MMKKPESLYRIIERFPHFYSAWENDSILFRLSDSVSLSIEEQRRFLYYVMRAHWIDTAFGINLDKLGAVFDLRRLYEERDDLFRRRIKNAVNKFQGGGTIKGIKEQVKIFLDLDEEPVLIDHPEKIFEEPGEKIDNNLELAQEQNPDPIHHNDLRLVRSKSLENKNASIVFKFGKGGEEIEEPSIMDVDRGFTITYKGKVRPGDKLVIKNDGKAELNDSDVSENMVLENFNPPLTLLRKGSVWKYSDLTSEKSGKFDHSFFDKDTFAIDVPETILRFVWQAPQPATFDIQLPMESLEKKGFTERTVREVVDTVKASGIKVLINGKDALGEGRSQ